MPRKLVLVWLVAMLAACGDARPPIAAGGAVATVDKDAFVLVDPAQCSSPTASVYRFRRAGAGASMVADEATKAAMLAAGGAASFEGEIFRQVVCGQAALPVYRFTNRLTQAEFYTADRIERDRTRAARPDLRYDGVAFHVAIGRLPGAVPVYRLSRGGDYFYTVSTQERDRLDFVEGWNSDGVAFHAYPPQVAPPSCPSGEYWSVPPGACVPLCPLATDVYVPGAGCQKKRACTGGTLLAATNTCQCPSGTVDDPVGDRCAPPPCQAGQLFVPGRGCEWPKPCFNGTLNAFNVCTCGENEILNELEHWCEYNVGFQSKTSENYVGGDDGGAGADGGGDAGAGQGAVRNAMVEFWGVDPTRAKLVFLGRALSDPVNGLVRFKRGFYDGPAWVRFIGREGATYFDESLGADVPFAEGAELNALVDKLDRGVGVTALTEAAYQYARKFYRSPGSTEPQAVDFILSNGLQVAANEFVRKTFNESMPPSAAVVTSITQLPHPVTASTPAGSLPNNKSGRYALQMNSAVYGAKFFNDQLRQSTSMGGVLGAPAMSFSLQYAADLSDGVLDSRVDGQSVAPTEQRTYTTRSSELESLGMPGGFLLSQTLSAGLGTATSTYASPSLAETVAPSNACLGQNAPTFSSGGYGPLCCPVTRVAPSEQWPSGCPLSGRNDYRRVYFRSTFYDYEAVVASEAVRVLAGQTSRGVRPANIGCSVVNPPPFEIYLYPTVYFSLDVPESQVSSLVAAGFSSAPIVSYSSEQWYLFDGTVKFPQCPPPPGIP